MKQGTTITTTTTTTTACLDCHLRTAGGLASLLDGEAALKRGEHDDHELDLEELVLQVRVEVDTGTEVEKYGRWLLPGEEYVKSVHDEGSP